MTTSARDALMQLLVLQRDGGPVSEPGDTLVCFEPAVFENFVAMELRLYAGYVGRHPRTGAKVDVGARYAVAWHADAAMREALNASDAKLAPIRMPAAPGIELDTLRDLLASARAALLTSGTGDLPGILTFIVRTKGEAQSGRKVLIVANLGRDRADFPDDPWRAFEDELNERLVRVV